MTLRSLLIKLGLHRPIVGYKYEPDKNHIEVLNYWTSEPNDIWLYQFVIAHFSELLTKDNSLLISSVFGSKRVIELSESRIKMFYTAENVMRFQEYKDQCRDIVDLMVGFDYLNDENYQRFPIWLKYFFPPDSDHKAIREKMSQFIVTDICADHKKKFASLVCSHDKGNIRTILFNSLSKVDRVDSGGKYMNNTHALKDEFNDEKGRFIGHYKFNICPENSNSEGYVTEKLFEAIRYNTIPVYWGSNNNPEPNILNKDAILFYEGKGKLDALNKQIKELHDHPKLYRDFINQPQFQPHAAEYIAEMFDSFKGKLHAALTKYN